MTQRLDLAEEGLALVGVRRQRRQLLEVGEVGRGGVCMRGLSKVRIARLTFGPAGPATRDPPRHGEGNRTSLAVG